MCCLTHDWRSQEQNGSMKKEIKPCASLEFLTSGIGKKVSSTIIGRSFNHKCRM